MDHATMSYAQLFQAYQALQERVIALEGAAAVQQRVQVWGHKEQHTALTRDPVIVPEAYLAGGGEMGQLIREHNWSATPLGAVETWPQSLRSAVSILLPSKAQIVLFWGPEPIRITRGLCADVGAKHRRRSVVPARVLERGWHYGPLFEGDRRVGVLGEGPPLLSPPAGVLEETSRRLDDAGRIEDGSVVGSSASSTSRPGHVLGERCLRILASRPEDGGREERRGDLPGGGGHSGDGTADVPFSLLYLIDGRGSARSSSASAVSSSTISPSGETS